MEKRLPNTGRNEEMLHGLQLSPSCLMNMSTNIVLELEHTWLTVITMRFLGYCTFLWSKDSELLESYLSLASTFSSQSTIIWAKRKYEPPL